MRRAALTAVVAAAAGLLGWLLLSGGGASYQFAAIFDNAKGLVAGQQVKIAGAVVGSVDTVELTPALDARIVMSISPRFAPLRADASCTILPEGLISENFVECNPGRAAAPLPRAGAGARAASGLPEVPLAHTTVPFSVQDVLNVFSLPTDERLRVLISELGIATAGRGQALNGLLLRADPALQQSRNVLAIIDAQRRRLTTAIGQTNTVLAQLATRQARVKQFVDDTAAVVGTTATHSAALGSAVAELPGMLTAVRPGLESLRRASTTATPLLAELHAAAPALDELTNAVPPFAAAGVPALRALQSTTSRGVAQTRTAVPFVHRLLGVSEPLDSARDAGALEGVLRLVYSLATESAMYDSASHIAAFIVNVDVKCVLGWVASTNIAGCSRRYSAPGAGELPINEPSCGAKSGAWLNEFCAPVAPGPLAFTRRPASQRLVSGALTGHSEPAANARSLHAYRLR
jgi:virulence factor Mce-like protein